MQEFKSYILGDLSIPYYLAAGVFCFLSIVLSLYLHSQKRDPLSVRTPQVFSWKFLFWDNTKRLVIGMILMFFFFRFSPEIFNKPLEMWQAVGIGVVLSFGLDKGIQFLQGLFPDLLKNAKP